MGRVLNPRTGRILKGGSSAHGNFTTVNLYNKGERKTHYIHHLVAEAFLAKPESDSDLITAHIDNDRSNNHHTNLRYMTVSKLHMSMEKCKVGSSRFKGVYRVNGKKR